MRSPANFGMGCAFQLPLGVLQLSCLSRPFFLPKFVGAFLEVLFVKLGAGGQAALTSSLGWDVLYRVG